MSAYYVVAYLSLSLPAVLGGLIVGGLGLQATFEVVGAIVVLLAFVAAIVAWRARPALRRADVATSRGGVGG
jgi:predicted MFS family arabinose efflux permease